MNNPFDGQKTANASVGTMMGVVLASLGISIALSYAMSSLWNMMQRPKLPAHDDDFDDDDFDDDDDEEFEGGGYADEYDGRGETERMLTDEDDEFDYYEAPPSSRRSPLSRVKSLPWDEYGEKAKSGAKFGWKKAKSGSKAAYSRVRALPWDEYGEKAKSGAKFGWQKTKSGSKAAYEGARRVPWKKWHDSMVYAPTPSSRATIPAAPPARLLEQKKTWVSPGATELGDDFESRDTIVDLGVSPKATTYAGEATPNRRRRRRSRRRSR